MEKAALQAVSPIAVRSGDILLLPNGAKKIKSPIENDSILNLFFNQRMYELTAGRIFFAKDFFSFFQTRHSKERQAEDREREWQLEGIAKLQE